MQRVADQIVDEHSATAYAERLRSECCQFRWLEVMREQAAVDQVEAAIAEGKSHRVGNQPAMPTLQVGRDSVEIGDVERDSFTGQLPACLSRHFAETRRHF